MKEETFLLIMGCGSLIAASVVLMYGNIQLAQYFLLLAIYFKIKI